MSIRFPLAALAAAIAPACGSSTSTGIVDPVADTVDQGHANGTALAAQAFDELSVDDPLTIVGQTASILSALNQGEINSASFAVQIITDRDVFQFGNDMIVDHDDALTTLDVVVRSYGVAYIPSSTEATVAGNASQDIANLRATPPGDFDFRYTEQQVLTHAEAQVLLDQLSQLVGPGQMDDYIANSRAMVDNHLARAEDLLRRFF